MNMKQLGKSVRREMARENAKRPVVLTQVPKDQWPPDEAGTIIEVWLSRHFLAQVHNEAHGVLRVSCNRTTMNQNGQWDQNISWDDLMQIKREIGRGESYAVEVLPEDGNIVNVANMRHFWILPKPICGWRKRSAEAVRG